MALLALLIIIYWLADIHSACL